MVNIILNIFFFFLLLISARFLQQIFERLNEHLKQSSTRMDTLILLGHIVRRQVGIIKQHLLSTDRP